LTTAEQLFLGVASVDCEWNGGSAQLIILGAIAGAVVAILLISLAVRVFVGSTMSKQPARLKPTGPEGMVGETAVVSRVVGDIHAGGMVHGRGEEWPAYSEMTAPIEVGQTVILLDFVRGKFLVADADPSLGI